MRLPATILVCALVLALALFSPAAAVPALAAALLTNLVLGLADVSDFWTVMAVFAVAVLLGGPLLASLLRSPVALGTLLVAVLGAYLLVLGIDGPSAALSPFGPSQNSRYFGLSNLLETMLLVPAFGGAALLFRRLGWVGLRRHRAPRVRNGGRQLASAPTAAERSCSPAGSPCSRSCSREAAGGRSRSPSASRWHSRWRSSPSMPPRAPRATSRRRSRTGRSVWPETSASGSSSRGRARLRTGTSRSRWR